MNASPTGWPFSASRNRRRSSSSGCELMGARGPTQRGRLYVGVPPEEAACCMYAGNSSRSCGVRRGLSPAKPLIRSLMYVA